MATSMSIKIPLHVLRSKISPSAKVLWIELSLVSSPKRPQVMVQPQALAEKMHVSTRTIQRLVAELVKADLLVHTGYILRRFKTYDLAWRNAPSVAQPEAAPVKSPLTPLLPRGEEELRPDVVAAFRKRFACLDGRSGRPRFDDCVQQAMSNHMRKRNEDPAIWVEIWLQNTEKMWIGSYNGERYGLKNHVAPSIHANWKGAEING